MDQTPIAPSQPTPTPPLNTGKPITETIPTLNPNAAQAPKKFPVALIAAVIGVFLLVIVGILFIKTATNQVNNSQVSQTTPVQKIQLTYWGLWESNDTLSSVISQFEQSNPGVVITYAQQSAKDYRERLQSAFTRGQGPDIFRFHNTWVPMLSSTLSVIPPDVMASGEFEKTYYPVAVSDLKTSQGYVGIPLMIDGLGLYVNKKVLADSGKTVPTTWDDLRTLGKELTIRDTNGKIQRSGLALGSANNVDHFSDILGLLILQNGGDPGKPSDTTGLVRDALTFYTQFENDKDWDDTLPNSTYAFATEKAAMMIAPSWRAFEIKQVNPNLEFEIDPIPQLPGAPITWASYWVEGVSKTSKYQEMAWKFLKYMSSKAVLEKLYASASGQRVFGEIYPRLDMASELANDPYAHAFISQAPYAKSWYLSSMTFDNGLNDMMIKYYQDALNTVNSGQSADTVLPTLTKGVNSVLSQYNLQP